MLIKLNALAHPDLNGGKPWPVFVDASRVLLITRTSHMHVKLVNSDVKREIYDDLFIGAQRLAKLLNEKMPVTIDDERTGKWAREMHQLCHDVNESYSMWGRAFRVDDYHPRIECTEVQMACGTALEHGVMLTRVWVQESPEEVHNRVEHALGRRMVP